VNKKQDCRGISKSLIASKTNVSKIAPVTLHVCNLYIGGPHVAELLDIQFIFSVNEAGHFHHFPC
jgi:hypothetical protein